MLGAATAKPERLRTNTISRVSLFIINALKEASLSLEWLTSVRRMLLDNRFDDKALRNPRLAGPVHPEH